MPARERTRESGLVGRALKSRVNSRLDLSVNGRDDSHVASATGPSRGFSRAFVKGRDMPARERTRESGLVGRALKSRVNSRLGLSVNGRGGSHVASATGPSRGFSRAFVKGRDMPARERTHESGLVGRALKSRVNSRLGLSVNGRDESHVASATGPSRGFSRAFTRSRLASLPSPVLTHTAPKSTSSISPRPSRSRTSAESRAASSTSRPATYRAHSARSGST
jgi:hypothetical protein